MKLHAENPDERPPQADPIGCPPARVEEPAGTSLDGLRTGIRNLPGEHHSQHHETEDPERPAHQVPPECSRTGRPLRKSTRYVPTGRQ